MFDIELQIVDCGSQSSRWPSTSHIDLCDQKTNQTSVKMRQLIVLWIFCWVVCVCVRDLGEWDGKWYKVWKYNRLRRVLKFLEYPLLSIFLTTSRANAIIIWYLSLYMLDMIGKHQILINRFPALIIVRDNIYYIWSITKACWPSMITCRKEIICILQRNKKSYW